MVYKYHTMGKIHIKSYYISIVLVKTAFACLLYYRHIGQEVLWDQTPKHGNNLFFKDTPLYVSFLLLV